MQKVTGDAASISTVHTLQDVQQSSLALALSSDNRLTFHNLIRLDFSSCMFTVFFAVKGMKVGYADVETPNSIPYINTTRLQNPRTMTVSTIDPTQK